MQPDMPMDEDPQVLQDEFAVPMLTDAGDPVTVDAMALTMAQFAGMSEVPCYGVACVEGIPDGGTPRRMFAPGELTFAPTPFTFKTQFAEAQGHDGSVPSGRVDAMWRDGALIRWIGALDNVGQAGRESVRLIAGGFVTGVSIKADDIEESEVEFVYAERGMPPLIPGADDELLDDAEAYHMPGKHNQKDHGNSKGPKNKAGPAPKGWKPNPKYYPKGLPGQGGSAQGEAFAEDATITAADEPVEIEVEAPEPNLMVMHGGRVRSLTLLPEAAFIECRIYLGISPDQPPMIADDVEVMGAMGEAAPAVDPYANVPVVAAAYTITIPDIWPESWFDEPKEMPPFGALHITPDGRVFGLLAPSRVDHRAFRASGGRVEAPRGIDYSEFQNKPALVAGADGHVYQINAGNVTFDCGHASPFDERRADPTWAMSHYDNSCSIAARIRVGESAHGTWVAGALMHGITPDTVERMMACALSGDWQGGKLNAALLVPVEGFPTRVAASVRVKADAVVASCVPMQFDAPIVAAAPNLRPALDRLARTVGLDRASRVAALRERVQRAR